MSLSDLVNPPRAPKPKNGRKVERLRVANRSEEDAENRKAATSARMKALNADPEFKAKMKALHADPEFAKANAERMRKLNADPEFTARILAAIREAKRNARGGALTAPIKRSRNGK